MKDIKNQPVEVVLTFNANNPAKNTIKAKLIASSRHEANQLYVKLDDNHKLVRRYSFDDNGGGYRGL